MNKVRFGIVGLGNQGTYYANLFIDGKINNAEISAICDINDKKIEILRKKINHPLFEFKNYKEMVNKKYIDALIITTPHYFHPEIAIYAFENHIHVLCDKPAGVYTKQVREMNEASLKSDVYFTMMFNQRANPLYQKMKDMIAQGELGKLQRITWIITDWFRTKYYYDSGSWRATWKGEGGGVLINQSPHQIDLISFILGEMPSSVNGFCKYGFWHDIEVEDEVTAYLNFKSGFTGVFITSTGESPGTNRLEISGSKGKLLCENNKLFFYENEVDSLYWNTNIKNGFEKPKLIIKQINPNVPNLAHLGVLQNFINAILGKEKLFIDGKEGINGVELMNAIELSGWLNGQNVAIPVDEELYFKELSKRIKTSRLKENNDNLVLESLNFGTGFENIKNK